MQTASQVPFARKARTVNHDRSISVAQRKETMRNYIRPRTNERTKEERKSVEFGIRIIRDAAHSFLSLSSYLTTPIQIPSETFQSFVKLYKNKSSH